MKTKYKILILLLSILIIFLVVGTPKYNSLKIKNKNFEESEKMLEKSIEKNSEVDISKIVDFEFDEIYIFGPYYPAKFVYEKVNQEWTKCRTYLGYIILHEAENESLNEDEFLMVFKKADKVIASNIYKVKNVDILFSSEKNRLTVKNAKLLVEKANERKVIKIK